MCIRDRIGLAEIGLRRIRTRFFPVAEIFADQHGELCGIAIADHHDNGAVGAIPAIVKLSLIHI